MIGPSRYEPRKLFDETELLAVADSIRQHGVQQPIMVRLVWRISWGHDQPCEGETETAQWTSMSSHPSR